MKSYEIFQEYIWLIDTINRAKNISLEDINRRWLQTRMSGGVEIARSTFIRHKTAIEDIFGVMIECDPHNDYKYHIANQEVLTNNSIQNWILSTFTVSNILSQNMSLQSRILVESVPSNGDHLRLFIDAMKAGCRISVQYRKYGTDEISTRIVEPYCVKLFNRRWYGLVRHMERGTLFMLSFDRLIHLELTNEHFYIPDEFDAETYFSECYGIVNNPDRTLEKVRIRAFGREQFYLRDLPFHHSQREIASGEDWTDFEYSLRISPDFYTPLLSRGASIQVMEPQWLAEEIKKQILAAYQRYL